MAPLEYETFGVSLFEAKDRFEEIREIVRLALKARPFTYNGKHYKIERETILRSGLDVVRLLALGAKGVMLGRAWAWALGARGEAGVRHMLRIIENEMRVAMSLTGATRIGEIDRTIIARET